LAVFLVVSWLVFSGFDLLEDLDLFLYSKVCGASRSAFPGFGRVAKVANNTLENGSRVMIAEIGPAAPPARGNVAFEPHDKKAETPKKSRKIYQLHSAFLI